MFYRIYFTFYRIYLIRFYILQNLFCKILFRFYIRIHFYRIYLTRFYN
ncbi:hypothetical protein [Helicobacter saguini]|nr:hypothetical protein [Helicobacter saguini]MWV61588.1 hypothetical protein [Helicobacter saguini]MWV70791.1 hypothetical protein [Helicobacter saguini]MWV72695.1 hypothetical protein [Helicobacter saguini]